MQFDNIINKLLSEAEVTKDDKMAALKSLQPSGDEYILFIGHTDMGEEYGNIRKIKTAEPKAELVLFAKELLGEENGLQEEEIEGEPGNYFAVRGGDDATYLAVHTNVFRKELEQAEWDVNSIDELMLALIHSNELTYEYIEGELIVRERQKNF